MCVRFSYRTKGDPVTEASRPQVVIASNRGPVSFMASDGGFQAKRGAGGLAGALDPVARDLGNDALWIAAAVSDMDRVAKAAGAVDRTSEDLGYGIELIDVPVDAYARYYDSVSNRMLWFANHCLFEEVGITAFGDQELLDWDEAYRSVNELFAEEIGRRSSNDALVLVQDYHLSLVPSMLRRSDSNHTICHFTHSSFCGPAGLARLPARIRAEVVLGMLGADLIGFHVRAWVDGFLDACRDLGADVERDEGAVTLQGRRSWVRAYPIAIDCADLRGRAASSSATEWAQRWSRDDIINVARADRAEPSKNIVRGFAAWEKLLERRPDLIGRARFIACIYPSRQSMPEYRLYSERISAEAERVNARFKGCIELYDSDDFDRTLGALRTYDVLLVNPIMDGMNLVSKEGACLNERDGVIVLSERAGSFDELGSNCVAIVDPLDLDATARALEEAIDMPQNDRRDRARRLRETVVRSQPSEWIGAQLEDLRAIRAEGKPSTPAVVR